MITLVRGTTIPTQLPKSGAQGVILSYPNPRALNPSIHRRIQGQSMCTGYKSRAQAIPKKAMHRRDEQGDQLAWF
jgi:hypothetical protein